VWGGANDILFQLGLAQAGMATPAQVQQGSASPPCSSRQAIGTLRAGGEQFITVFNVPDIGMTPFGVGSGQGAQITALASFFIPRCSARSMPRGFQRCA
jgi:outer membrane lipase/esterase